MAKRVQLIRYDSATLAAIAGKDGELMINTSARSVHVHDGATLGGFELARADVSNVPNATASVAGKMTGTQVAELTAATADILIEAAARIAADALKANLIVPAAVGNVATLDASGDLTDSGQTITQIIAAAAEIPSGEKMLFGAAAAPAGWTIDNTFSDKVIRVVNDTVTGAYATDWATDGNGGTWTISGITVNGHAITVAQMPAHTHTAGGSGAFIQWSGGTIIQYIDYDGSGTPHYSATATGSKGGNATHNHGLTIGSAWRPSYLDMIMCTKD